MKNSVRAKAKIVFLFCGLIFVFAQIFSVDSQAQTRRKTPARTSKKKAPTKRVVRVVAQSNLPKVTQIDTVGLKNLLKREGENAKPLLINFWATWCDPCREEFPELVKINADYKGKIDFVTISMDYLSEIKRDVPKFLAEMKAEMPAYLLKTADESEAVTMVSKDWQGALPFTILYDASGNQIYIRQGKIKLETVRAEIDKALNPPKPLDAFERGKLDAEKDLAAGKLIVKGSFLARRRRSVAEEYGIKLEQAPIHKAEEYEYIKGYNSISEAEILKKFGAEVLNKVKPPVNYPPDVTELTLTVSGQKIN
jgi:thiol-disulfide isomerase/thioredoxin